MKSLKDILAEGVAVSSDFKLVNSVDSQGRPTTRKVRAHRKTISPKKDDSEEKPDVLTSIQKFVGRQYGEEVESVEEGRNDTPVPYGSLLNRPASPTVAQTGPRKGMITKKYATRLKDRIKASLNKEEVEQVDEVSLGNYKEKASQQVKELKPFTKGEFGDVAKRAIERRTKGLKMAMKREEVELDEVSTDGYHKAAVKSRMDAALKVMSSMGSDKQAKTKLDARNKGLKRLSDRTSAEMAKANSGPQKQQTGKEPTEAERRGYGQGRYMGDSVELEGEIIEASQSPSMRMFKALQKVKKQREEEEVRKKENEKRALTPKQTNEAKDPREYDYEGDMAKTQLRSIIANSQAVHDMLKDTTNIAEWVQSKITKAEDYISTVADYMTAEMNEQTYDPFADDPEADAKHEAEVRAKMKEKLQQNQGTKIKNMKSIDRDQYLQNTGRRWNDETNSIEKIKPQAAASEANK